MTGTPTPPPSDALQEVPGASLTEVIAQLAEAVVESQRRLDRSSAAAIEELAASKVAVVPSIKQVIERDGSVRFESAAPVELSLLDVGVMPAFYAFSEATAELAMDLQVTESVNEIGETKKRKLFAGTQSLRAERRLTRDVRTHSKLTVKLVPVPAPAGLAPTRVVEDRRTGGGG